MASAKPQKPDVVTYGDHELITPDTSKLRKLLRNELPGEADPVEQAEQALAAISGDFDIWMNDELERLDTARRKVKELGLSKQTRQELFLAAHDVKGDSATLGYPEVGPAADSLCRLLEHTPDLQKIPMAIVDQHVDAVRAIVREHGRADIMSIATALTSKLRTVTDEFLVKENLHRPDVLKTIKSPSLAPGESF
jgi:HPt (histidine-containing phosphotransfer) domain-containing protein